MCETIQLLVLRKLIAPACSYMKIEDGLWGKLTFFAGVQRSDLNKKLNIIMTSGIQMYCINVSCEKDFSHSNLLKNHCIES